MLTVGLRHLVGNITNNFILFWVTEARVSREFQGRTAGRLYLARQGLGPHHPRVLWRSP